MLYNTDINEDDSDEVKSNKLDELAKRSHIGNINPIRYRGYYYDVESSLYYLNTRYYDPQIGRFINADEITILDETRSQIHGLNLYMYCGNNPVGMIDPSGRAFFATLFIAMLVGAAIGGITNAVGSAVTAGINGQDMTAAFFGGLVGGAIMGIGIAICVSFSAIGLGAVGIGLGTVIGALGGFAGSITQQSILGEEINRNTAGIEAGVGALYGLIGSIQGVVFAKSALETIGVYAISTVLGLGKWIFDMMGRTIISSSKKAR